MHCGYNKINVKWARTYGSKSIEKNILKVSACVLCWYIWNGKSKENLSNVFRQTTVSKNNVPNWDIAA